MLLIYYFQTKQCFPSQVQQQESCSSHPSVNSSRELAYQQTPLQAGRYRRFFFMTGQLLYFRVGKVDTTVAGACIISHLFICFMAT